MDAETFSDPQLIKNIANKYVWLKLNTETESHLMVADADGKNARTVMSAKSNRATTITIGSLDWR